MVDEQRAIPQQYESLTHLLEQCGVNPRDLATLCALKYKNPYYNLTYNQAENLASHIHAVGPNQFRVRQWISDQVDLYTDSNNMTEDEFMQKAWDTRPQEDE